MSHEQSRRRRRGIRFRHDPAVMALESLGWTTAVEVARFHEHVAVCGRCRDESARWADAVTSLAALCPPAAPPVRLKAALLARLAGRRV